ncbi:uncharacterized protein LOC125778899 [Bactrocera dorsalis]|uniref:Uncharacterized protein LOC125778899 n=1 Tax=Bactrocera dorsalis TaxID=27457 RepID=A0ABM3JZ12_BACDO|nr:uncharacterized protein LOC125778899 [Bactrocera dorsalis]
MSASQPHQQGRRHSLNAYFSFVDPTTITTTANKKCNGDDESSRRSAEKESKQRTQSAVAAENNNRAITNALTPTSLQVPTNEQATKKITRQGESVPTKKSPSVQTGIDRYVNIKRKLSPSKSAVNPKKFQGSTPNKNKTEVLNGNRFAILSNGSDDDAKGTTTVVHANVLSKALLIETFLFWYVHPSL